jgi:serine/threonine protein kinase/TolB-like protein
VSSPRRDALAEGTLVNGYQIVSVLGTGGFGITYLAEEKNLGNRQVAIKEYLPSQFAGREADDSVCPHSDEAKATFDWGLDRFLKEAVLLSSLRHPSIVDVFTAFKANGTAYMVMRLEEGRTLTSVVKASRGVTQAFLKGILPPLLDGLEAIHSKDIIHRDIKPDNIIIRSDGSPVLIDFGSARVAESDAAQQLTAVYTPGYSPPEQRNLSDSKQGPWTDIYGLGATLYYCISGKVPRDSTARNDSLRESRADSLIAIQAYAGDGYSELFLGAINWALQFWPEKRPQAIGDWRPDLIPSARGGREEIRVDSTPGSQSQIETEKGAAEKPSDPVLPSESGPAALKEVDGSPVEAEGGNTDQQSGDGTGKTGSASQSGKNLAAADPDATLWQKLKQMRVVQTLTLYVPIAWICVEILIATVEKLLLPQWISSMAMIVFIAGIPVAAFLAWAFQWGAAGLTLGVKSWRAGLVFTVALALLFGVSTALYLSVDRNQLLDGGNALIEPLAVVAVLPFDQSGAENRATGDGFTLEITDRLKKHPELYVVDPVATFSPKLASLSPVRQQEKLQADHIVAGHISADAQGQILSVQLTGVSQDVLWEGDFRFGADVESRVGVQLRVSQEIAKRLGVRYKSADYCDPTDNLEALESYHAARLKLNQKGPENLSEAERLLKRAVELDPEYGHAYSALAIAYLLQRKAGSKNLAVDISRKALDRCATLGMAYKIWVPPYEGVTNNWINDELQWRDALAMEPNNLWMLDNYAQSLAGLGRGEAAAVLVQRSLRSNPLDPRALVTAGWVAVGEGQVDRALELADQAEQQGDQSCNVGVLRVVAGLEVSEQFTVEAYEALPDRCKGIAVNMQDLGPAVVYQSRHQAAARRTTLEFSRDNIEKTPNVAMIVGIDLSDPDLAFDAIALALEQGSYIHFEAWWDDTDAAALFRRDPRFSELVEELGLEEYWREFGWPDGKCTPFGDSFVCDK